MNKHRVAARSQLSRIFAHSVALSHSVSPLIERLVRLHRSQKRTGTRPSLLRFPIQEQILFAKRLSMILRAGMPIMEGLRMLRESAGSRSTTYVYESLMRDISHGQSLSKSLQEFDRIFGAFCINIVRVGESAGTLPENLNYLAEELKKKQALKRKVIGALIYPAIILFATFGITVMLTIYIFPKITPIFQSVKATLPLSTRTLMTISDFLSAWGLWLVLVFFFLGIGYFLLLSLPRFHRWVDMLLVRLPLFGELSKYYNLANISRTLALLLKSDMRIVPSIELVADSTRNLVYREELLRARERLLRGQNISQQFRNNSRLFPGLFTQMLVVAENTGHLPDTLTYVSVLYEEEIDELTKNLTTMLEPILMIVMGAIVSFIAISIIAPIYSITQNLTPHH